MSCIVANIFDLGRTYFSSDATAIMLAEKIVRRRLDLSDWPYKVAPSVHAKIEGWQRLLKI